MSDKGLILLNEFDFQVTETVTRVYTVKAHGQYEAETRDLLERDLEMGTHIPHEVVSENVKREVRAIDKV